MGETEDGQNELAECEDLNARETTSEDLKEWGRRDDKDGVENGRVMAEPKMAFVLLPGEHQDIRVDVDILLANGSDWLATPNTYFGGRMPESLIGTADEALLRETLRSAIYSGMA